MPRRAPGAQGAPPGSLAIFRAPLCCVLQIIPRNSNATFRRDSARSQRRATRLRSCLAPRPRKANLERHRREKGASWPSDALLLLGRTVGVISPLGGLAGGPHPRISIYRNHAMAARQGSRPRTTRSSALCSSHARRGRILRNRDSNIRTVTLLTGRASALSIRGSSPRGRPGPRDHQGGIHLAEPGQQDTGRHELIDVR